MRTLLAAAVLLGLLLPVGVDAKPFSSGRSDTSARKAKSSRRSVDNAPLVVDGASSKRSKRRADDPVLRRYGKKPQDVAYVDYDADKSTKKSAKKSKKEEILVIEDAPAKKSSKKSKAVKAQADEEILIIEEETPAKKPVKATKAPKAETPAKKSKTVVADDDDMPRSKAKKSIVDDDDDKPAKKSKKKPVADDDDEITITLD